MQWQHLFLVNLPCITEFILHRCWLLMSLFLFLFRFVCILPMLSVGSCFCSFFNFTPNKFNTYAKKHFVVLFNFMNGFFSRNYRTWKLSEIHTIQERQSLQFELLFVIYAMQENLKHNAQFSKL